MRIIWGMTLGLALAGCAPGDNQPPVGPELMTPQARADRNASLQGGASPTQQAAPMTASARPAPAAQGAPMTAMVLHDDQTYHPDPSAPAGGTVAAGTSYPVVAPKPLPPRPTDSGPSVVAYALSATNAVGQPLYTRETGSTDRAARACARYSSDDLAQAAFLAEGGPAADNMGLDPDGDGYACAWDPTPFRQAVK